MFIPLAEIANPGAVLAGVSEQQQISYLSDYYSDFREKWSVNYIIEVRDERGEGAKEQPFEKIGSAARAGLDTLLTSRNMLPYGKGSKAARLITHCFDSSPGDVINTTWLERKQLVIRYYWHVHSKIPSCRVRHGNIVGSRSKKKVEEHYRTVKNQLVAVLIVKCAYGFDFAMPTARSVRLHELSTWQDFDGVYYKFVLPMIKFVATEMNPHAHLDVRTILNTNLSRVEEKLKGRTSNGGVWSHDLLQFRLRLPKGHPLFVDHRDLDLTKGTEFNFARLASLIVPNYKLPYNLSTNDLEKLNITRSEYDRLYQGYDAHAVAQYDEPTYP